MLWLIPFLLFLLFLLLRFVKTHQESNEISLSNLSGPWWKIDDHFTKSTEKEGFVTLQVSHEFQEKYKTFLEFYHPFLIRWRDALVTAYQLEKEVGKATSTVPPDSALNSLVRKLIDTQGKPLPPLTDQLPTTVTSLNDLDLLQEHIPKDSQPFFNALEWMNAQLLKAQQEVESALQGGGGIPSFEGFEGTICSDLSKCFKDNPELIRQLVKAQQEDDAQRLERLQRELVSRFEQFQQPRIHNAFELNARLSKKAKEIQSKAQSGDWIKDVKFGGESSPSYSIPAGGNQMEELRARDPAAYQRLQQQSQGMGALKGLFEQINRNLR